MAEFENGYCTGCGYHRKRGHRPYCWRKGTMMVNGDTSMKNIRRCLREMAKYHRFRALFLSRSEHTYYTVKSIDEGAKEKAKSDGCKGYYECDNCGFVTQKQEEVWCWQCGKGQMGYCQVTGERQ